MTKAISASFAAAIVLTCALSTEAQQVVDNPDYKTIQAQQKAESTVDRTVQENSQAAKTNAPGAKQGSESATGTQTTLATGATAENSTTPSRQPLTEIYRVGVGDVLDIRFLSSATPRSTLFTVVNGGLIDLPVAGGPIAVGGLTPEEIQKRIATELKRRAVEETTKVSVGVRQYSSHPVVITGLVINPGTRFLRREAVPLYVVLAESQLRNDAGQVMVMRGNSSPLTFDLSDANSLNTAVQSGDVITVAAKPQEFYYIGGRINYSGQRVFQSGITLLQAILASGGTRQKEHIVEISRDAGAGRLVTTRFNLKEIKAGTVEDPKLKPGDRVEVIR